MVLGNKVVGAINFIALLFSIPVIGAGIWLANGASDSFDQFLHWPLFILGVLILIVALAAIIGAFCRIQRLLIFYRIAMLVRIILLVCLVVFIYIVTIKGHGTIPPNRVSLEYRLGEFSEFLRQRVSSDIQWDGIKSRFANTSMCDDLDQRYIMAEDFFKANLTALQAGCCMPPTLCKYKFVDPTYWVRPITVEDVDCTRWSNNQTQHCYDCDSCKASVLANLKKDWRRTDVILVITVIVLIVIYIIGCFAFWNAKTEDLYRRFERGSLGRMMEH